MKKLINKTIIFLAVIVTCSFNNLAMAQNTDPIANGDEKKVRDFVQDVGNNIVKITSDKSLTKSQVEGKMIGLIDGIIDPDWISRFVLGKFYKTVSDQQKSRFSQLYREYMINTYGPKFQHYNIKKFTLISSEDQHSFYLAKCEFMQKDSNTPISVDFRVKNKDGKLVVIDLITEGISLIETQRSEFSSAIAQGGVEQFLDDLQKKVNNLKRNSSYIATRDGGKA
jgi:phospholipid transport system substrate-binding protein